VLAVKLRKPSPPHWDRRIAHARCSGDFLPPSPPTEKTPVNGCLFDARLWNPRAFFHSRRDLLANAAHPCGLTGCSVAVSLRQLAADISIAPEWLHGSGEIKSLKTRRSKNKAWDMHERPRLGEAPNDMYD